MQIIPAILTSDLNEFTTLLSKAEIVVDRVQIDCIDGQYVTNTTVDPEVLKNIATNINFDFHLMVKEPINWISKCVNNPKTRIIGQIEFMQNQNDFINTVKKTSALAGLGIDLATAIEKLDETVLLNLDLLLIMSVNAGFDHQEFDLNVWDKIKKAVELRRSKNAKFKITVDGGVTKEIIRQMEGLGVDEVYVGKRIFDPDLKDNLRLFSENGGTPA